MALVDIQVPDIGDFDEVTVIELLVKPGDTVAAEQSLITVESDKASMEIPCSAAGVVKELKVKLGDKVKQGSIVLTLEGEGAAAAPAAAAEAPAKPRRASRPGPAWAGSTPATRESPQQSTRGATRCRHTGSNPHRAHWQEPTPLRVRRPALVPI